MQHTENNESEIINKFIDDNDEKAMLYFSRHIGADSEWFSAFLRSMKNEWVKEGYPITDILIREDMPIMVANIKSYVPFSSSESRLTFLPKKEQIIAIVKIFTKGAPEHGDVREFSFLITGIGIFRVSFSYDESGVGMSIRYLSFTIPKIEKVSYPQFYTDFIKSLIGEQTIMRPGGKSSKVGSIKAGGLILHVGPTGSGKTTSIAAETGHFADKITGQIATYENPIEYRFKATLAPVRQYEIESDIKKTKDRTLIESIKRHLLRNNPSMIMIGEARDNDEIRGIIDIAARGHLVESTMHASTVMEALSTLMNVTAEESYLLSNTLHAIVAHKLVTNKKGETIALYEILIPNSVVKEHLSKGGQEGLKSIKDIFIKEQHVGNSISFKRSLSDAINDGRLTPTEGKEIAESSYGIFA